jgi:hypothetical protein
MLRALMLLPGADADAVCPIVLLWEGRGEEASQRTRRSGYLMQ